MINKLHDSIIRNEIDATIAEVLKGIVDYTQYHFDAEEDVMHKIGYPATKGHVQLHRELMREVAGKLNRYKQGENISVFELMGFLRTWLVKHILREDKKISVFMGLPQESNEPAAK